MDEYTQQAEDFLTKTETRIRIDKVSPQWEKPIWAKNGGDYGLHYRVTLENIKGKVYSFDYWGSIADKKKNKRPTRYNVLACLNTYDLGSSFNDFCDAYGYDTDSKLATETYKTVIEQAQELKKLYTEPELNALNEIN